MALLFCDRLVGRDPLLFRTVFGTEFDGACIGLVFTWSWFAECQRNVQLLAYEQQRLMFDRRSAGFDMRWALNSRLRLGAFALEMQNHLFLRSDIEAMWCAGLQTRRHQDRNIGVCLLIAARWGCSSVHLRWSKPLIGDV